MPESEQTEIEVLKVRIEYIADSMDKMDIKRDKGLECIRLKLDKILESSPRLYAAKWVETAMKGFVGLILLVVIGSVVAGVIK